MGVYHLLVNRKFPGRLTNTKIKQIRKHVKQITEKRQKRIGNEAGEARDPFKRRGMQTYIGLYSIYAFTTSVARVLVQNS